MRQKLRIDYKMEEHIVEMENKNKKHKGNELSIHIIHGTVNTCSTCIRYITQICVGICIGM